MTGNESGTDLETSVPDLYKQIRGKVDWRTVIVSAEPVYGNRKGPVPDEKNPFDFPAEAAKAAEDAVPQDSAIPLVRLTHMICGYPAAPVKNFEEAYEYVDVETWSDSQSKSFRTFQRRVLCPVRTIP